MTSHGGAIKEDDNLVSDDSDSQQVNYTGNNSKDNLNNKIMEGGENKMLNSPGKENPEFQQNDINGRDRKDKMTNDMEFDSKTVNHCLESWGRGLERNNRSGPGSDYSSFDSSAAQYALNQHRMNLLQQFHSSSDNQSLNPATSKLLREILQDKERMKHQQKQLQSAGMVEEYMGKHNESVMVKHNESVITQLLKRNGSVLRNGGMNSEDQDPVSVETGSVGDSTDGELFERCRDEDGDGESDRQENGSDADVFEKNEDTADDKDLKRARVENIVTTMRTQENRRKRKQSQPQQHDTNSTECDQPKEKFRKIEKDILRQQLLEMQDQLQRMHARYVQLYDHESETMEAPMAGEMSLQLKKEDAIKQVSNEKENICKNNDLSQGDNPVKQRLNFSEGLPPYANAVANMKSDIKHVNTNREKNSGNFQDLAKKLKYELSTAVGNVVEKVIAKYVEECKPKPTKLPAPSPPAMTTTPKTNNTFEDLPRSISRESERTMADVFRSKAKLFDSQTTPERFPRSFLEIPRPIPLHSMYGNPFYYPSQVPPQSALPHLPPAPPLKEPEQTEALALVMNTPPPKKKRTKVTDTRLSPRAARALLQEPVPQHSENSNDKRSSTPTRENGGSYHPIIPASLPTSVAIPNPSLQHSDVLAMYTNGEHHGYYGDRTQSSANSPPMGDNGSPSMPHTPTEGLRMLRNDHSEHYAGSPHPSESSYENIQTISFFNVNVLCLILSIFT